MMYWGLLGILFLISAVLCAVGFKKFIYFLSVGYGLAVAGEGVAIAVFALTNGNWTVALLLQCLLFLVYGFRLSGFLLLREM
nr:steroid reductase [Oscillospiraceae bacterium]